MEIKTARKRINKEIRLAVFHRDNFRCFYCGEQVYIRIEKYHHRRAVIDHFVSLKIGGKNEFSNYVTACLKCNAEKSAKTIDAFRKAFQKKRWTVLTPIFYGERNLPDAKVSNLQNLNKEQNFMWKNENTTFESAPEGTHLARCVKIIDIGTQVGEYKGEKTVARKNIIFWELPNEIREDGKPFIVSKFYTASLGEKANLRKDLTAWRGREFTADELRGFDEKNILDKCCQVTVIKKENGKTAVSSVAGVPKGMPIPERHNDLVFFSLNDFQQESYDKLSDGIKKLIKDSVEFPSLNVAESSEPEREMAAPSDNSFHSDFGDHVQKPEDDDIPF